MQSIMAAIPILTPGKPTRSSPRTSLGATPRTGTPRLKKSTPGSATPQSFAKKGVKNLQKEDEYDSEVHNASEMVGDSVQLEQDEVVSASTPRATIRSLSAAVSSKKAADSARPAVRTGRISEILNRADIGVEELEEPREPEEPGDEAKMYDFVGFSGYRWAGDSIELQVKWKKDEEHDSSEEWEGAEDWEEGKMTWEPERSLHEDAPEFLIKYWREQGGRPENPTNPGMYEIFAILKHNKNRTKLLIEWVGYERSEASWVLRKDIPETAKDIVDAYFANVKTKSKKK
ncbi:hypothetical protein TrVFT333_004523 [Trichoderma virens FT-333]|nr:hypothetical protein TrVFT333_004523 [Trichoderma virens FT-333]